MDKVKIYDCFMYWNGLELFELRMMTLYDHVDYFVINEAAVSHVGKSRKMELGENLGRFRKWEDKIRYMPLQTLPYTDARQNEAHQRNNLIEGCWDAGPEDYIMISDDDEIPNPIALEQGKNSNKPFFILKTQLFYYYVNCKQIQQWHGPYAVKRKYFQSGQVCRDSRWNDEMSVPIMGGWHYSFLGGAEKISDKLNSFSEQQVNTKEANNIDNIRKCLETGEDIFGREEEIFRKTFIPVEEVGHPQLKEWLRKYPQFAKV